MAEKENQVPESSDCPPLKKKPRLSFSLKKKLPLEECNITISRFAEPVDGNTMEEAVKGVVPQNTEKNNEWAWNHFLHWASARFEKLPSDPVPCDLLSSSDPNLLCKWLCFFVMETRQACGKLYPPKTSEKLISEKTGHRSLTALRIYEHTSCVQEQAVTKAVSNNEEICFDSLSVPGHSKDKEIDKADTKTQMAKSKLPTFTGQLKNCVFNFY